MVLTDLFYTSRLLLDVARGTLEKKARALAAEVDWSGWQPGRPSVLCLDRALFRKDLEQLRPRANLNFPTIGVARVKKPQEAWIGPKWRRQTYFGYDLDHRLRAARQHLVAFGKAFLQSVVQTHPIHAVMAANTDYWQDVALQLACRELNIPFLVLSRENYGIKFARETLYDIYEKAHFEYLGKGVAVASETCVACLKQSGSLNDAQITVTGWPRFDAWSDVVPAKDEDRIFITLLSYAAPLYWAQDNFTQVLESFVDAAISYRSRNPDGKYRFVVKMKKPNETDIHYEMCPRLREAPVEITADIPLPEIAPRSRIVIGYNTLAVLESLLGGGAVVIPCWSDAKRSPDQSLMHYENPQDASVAYFPTSLAEFNGLLNGAIDGRVEPKGSREACYARFSKQSLLTPGISASARVEDFIRSFIPADRQSG